MLINRVFQGLLLAVLFIAVSIQPVLSAEFVAIKSKKTILYEGPSDSTSKEFIVTESYPLKVLVKLKDWTKVKDHEGKISWVKVQDTSNERTVMTLKSNVIVFYKPSFSSVKLADVGKYVALKLLSPIQVDGWIEVKTLTQNIEGFIRVQDVWGI